MYNKKAWLKIIEAFIAVILIMGSLLIIISNQRANSSNSGEIMNLQKSIINSINSDENLRNQILNNNLSGVNKKIEMIIPSWLNYSTRNCSYNDICSLGYTVNSEIYASESLIMSNLTDYAAGNSVKLKIFFWKIK